MKRTPITITATTLGRAQYNPDYSQREYMDKGDIPNHLAAALAFIRQDLKPGEKIIVQNGKLFVVEKSAFDRLADWVAGRKMDKSARPSSLFRVKIFPIFQKLVLHPES